MRVVFAGTPDFAAAHLKALLDANVDIVAVYTQPDRPAGRGNKLKASEVKILALEHNLPVIQVESLKKEEAQEEFKQIGPDLMIVVAYGLILPKSVLSIPTFGCINVHGSILPKHRGAAPIQRAIWAGDKETGVTIMQMDEGLDTGDILSIKTTPIAEKETSASLYAKLAELGPKALVEFVKQKDRFTPVPQNDNEATYASKLSKQEAKFDWKLEGAQLERNVRAFFPWPIAWFEHNGQPVKVYEAIFIAERLSETPGEILSYDNKGLCIAVIGGSLCLKKIQLAGKKPQDIAHLVNGMPQLFTVGNQLS